MPSLAFYLWISPIVVALGTLVYLWWDKRRVLVEAEDPVTGKTMRAKVRPKPEGIPWTKGPGPDLMVHADSSLMGTYVGWFFERPMIRINARSGNQMASVTLDPDRDAEEIQELASSLQESATAVDEDAEVENSQLVSLLGEMSWSEIYKDLIDSEAMRQAAEANKPPWERVQFALLASAGGGIVLGYVVALAMGAS